MEMLVGLGLSVIFLILLFALAGPRLVQKIRRGGLRKIPIKIGGIGPWL